MEEGPVGHVDGEDQSRGGEEQAGVEEERPEVDRSPARPPAHEHERHQHDRAGEDGEDLDRRDEPEDAAGQQRPDSLAQEGRQRGVGGDAVHLVVVRDEQDSARGRRRREAAEDGQLAQIPGRHDDQEEAEAGEGVAPRDRRHSAALRAPGPPSIPQEGDPDRAAQQHAVVSGEGRQADHQARPARTIGGGPAGRGRPATGRPCPAAGRARSCRAGPCRWPRRPGAATAIAGRQGDSVARPDFAGQEPGHRRRQRPDEQERDRRRQRRGAEQPHRRQLHDRRERHPVGVARDRQHRLGRDSAAHVHERPDEVDVEAVPGLQRPGHVDVVVRSRDRRRPGAARTATARADQGERIQSDGDPHGVAA